MCDSEDGYVIRARGLPWSCTKEEVQEFFKGANIKGGLEGIKFTFTDEGRPSGECFVELLSKEDVEEAMKKHTQNMGHRYVEVFASKISEMEWVTKRSGSTSLKNNDGWLRLRGLPFDAGNVEIAQFFGDLEIVTNTITFLQDHQLRNTGEAYVQFASKEIAEKALEKNKQTMGHRYIEIFRSSQDEVMRAKRMNSRGFIGGGRPGPYDRFGGGGGGYGGRGFGGGPRSGFERRYRGDQGWSGGGYEEDFGFSGGYGGGPGAGWFNRRGGMGMGMRGAGRGGAGGGARGGFGRMLGMFGGGGGGGGAGGGGGGGGRGSGFGGGDGQDFESDTGHAVFMRGLPFKVDDDAIREWFRGTANPVSIYIHKNDMGRNTGNAHVEFATHTEALAAMSKDKKNMAHRYIELFLKSEPDDTTGGYGSSNTSGMGGGTGSYGTNSGSGYGMGGSGAGFTQQSNMMSGNTGYTSFGSTGGYGQGDGSAGGGYDGYNNSGMGMGGGDDYTY